MISVTPTVTTSDPHEYRQQIELIATYADGVHIDFADGEFAPVTLLPLDQAWRSSELITHIHIMYRRPFDVLAEIMRIQADLVILHAESEDLIRTLHSLRQNGTRTGIALLPETPVSVLKEQKLDGLFDHVLLFAGHLGYQGGQADMHVVNKIQDVQASFPDVEIGWDGGVTQQNIRSIGQSGVQIINVGSELRHSTNPKSTYTTLQSLVS